MKIIVYFTFKSVVEIPDVLVTNVPEEREKVREAVTNELKASMTAKYGDIYSVATEIVKD